MSTASTGVADRRVPASPARRLSGALYRRPWLRRSGLLAPPLLWLLVLYLGALFALLLTSFFSQDEFTGQTIREFTLENFQSVFTDTAYLHATIRTIGIAASVTVICAVLGLPMAFFMAKVAAPRWRGWLVALVITPLWASYLVKVYSWRAMLQPEGGVVSWLLAPLGLSGPGFGVAATVITLAYLWLPYMVLPIYAGLDRMPQSLLDASADLGAHLGYSFRRVVLPILYPSIIAGSIFTFSLSLGDYITVQIVGGTTQMLGNIVYQNYTTSLPFAAAVATIPIAIMLVYLWLVRRSGALDNL